jgi:hypothetical protein
MKCARLMPKISLDDVLSHTAQFFIVNYYMICYSIQSTSVIMDPKGSPKAVRYY